MIAWHLQAYPNDFLFASTISLCLCKFTYALASLFLTLGSHANILLCIELFSNHTYLEGTIAIPLTHTTLHKRTRCVRTHLNDIKDRDIMNVATLLNIVDEKIFPLGQKMCGLECIGVCTLRLFGLWLFCIDPYMCIVEVEERLFF